MDRDEIIECAKALVPWHYDFEIVEGVRTHSLNDPEDPNHTMILALDPQRIVPIFKRLYPEGLAGKDVLDIGCNAGGYCFLAAELGARSAVGFDIRQHWLNQAALIHRTKYPELKNVAFKIGDAKTALKDFGSVDIVIFNGIFYHLPDPVGVLLQACDVARETIFVNTMTSDNIPENCLVPKIESKTQLLSGVDGLSWIPGGPAVMRIILRHAGFERFEVNFHARGLDDKGRGRMEVIGRR
jgi:tRNA (mo5U34)-methyltransferase